MPPAKKVVQFDLAKLAKLPGPFRLYLTRQLPGGGKEPIPLPQAEWSNQEVIDFENNVVTRIAGGGKYEAQVATLDGGDGFTWTFSYPETVYPKMVPPGSQSAYVPPPVTVQGAPVANHQPMIPVGQPFAPQNQPPQHHATPISQLPPGYPPGYPPQYPPGYPSAYGQPIPQYPYQNSYQPPRQQAATTELDQLKKELEQTRLANQTVEHRREREADAARHNAEMAALRDEIRRAAEASKRPTGDSPELQALKNQNAMLQKQIEQQAQSQRDMMAKMDRQQSEQQAKAASDAEQRRHDERMRQVEETSRREMQAIKDQMALMQANSNKSDPMLPFLMESQRQAADVAREQARTAANAPQQLMSIVEGVRRSSGSDTIMTNLAGAYDSVNNMAMRNAEMMANFLAQGQGSPVMNMVGDALHGGKEILAQMATAKARAEEAKATADAAREQQRAAVEYAQANAAAVASAAAAAPAPSNGVPDQPPLSGADQEAVQEAVNVAEQAEHAETEAGAEVTNLEEKLFGPVLWPEVEKLRQWIADEGVQNVDPSGVSVMLIQASVQMGQHGLEAPVLYLFQNQQWAELFDRVLPDADPEFVAECVDAISRIMTRLSTVTNPEEITEILQEALEAGQSAQPEPTASN